MPQAQTIKSESPKLVKKFKCNYCDRYFTRSEHRSRHELSHSSERPYRCTQCVSSFVRRDLLLRHCRTVHQGSIMPPPKKVKTERRGSYDQQPGHGSGQHHHQIPNGQPPGGADGLPNQLPNGLGNGHNNNNGIGAANGMRRPSAADSLLSLANGTQQEISTAMLMTEMGHSPQQSTQPIQMHYSPPEQRGLLSLGGAPPLPGAGVPGGPPPIGDPLEPLTQEDLRDISATYLPKVNFDPPQFQRIAPDINTPVPVPQFGPDFNAKVFLDQIKQRPSIRTEFGNAKDITRLQMDRYFSAFFCFFHPIMPMFHTQSFNTHTASPYLLYSILAMGAVLCHEVAVAQIFSYNSRMVLNPDIYCTQNQLQLAQTLILIVIYASYTGDMAGAETAAARTMMLKVVEQVLDERGLKRANQKMQEPQSWHEWIHDQVCIRTYWCSLIAVTTMACIFNASGVVSLDTINYNILLPCSEVIWNNQFNDEHEWRTRLHQEIREIPMITIGELLDIVDRVNEYISHPPVLNPFSVRVLGNILFLRTSGVGPGTDPQRIKQLSMQIGLWQAVARDPYPGMGQGAMLAMANLPLISIMKPLVYQNESTLDLPQSIIMAMQCRQHPIIILSYTLLGTARLQLILDLGLVRESLNYRSAERVAEAALTCLTSLQGNGDDLIENMTRVVIGSCDVVRATCLLGHRMYQSFLQSPLTGSIAGQCMILAYELILGIIIWCHRVEERIRESAASPQIKPLDEKLRKVYQWITEICREAGIHQVYGTLAPALAESIAELYDAITTWRLAEVMAMSLRLFARGLLNSHSEIMQTRYQGYYRG